MMNSLNSKQAKAWLDLIVAVLLVSVLAGGGLMFVQKSSSATAVAAEMAVTPGVELRPTPFQPMVDLRPWDEKAKRMMTEPEIRSGCQYDPVGLGVPSGYPRRPSPELAKHVTWSADNSVCGLSSVYIYTEENSDKAYEMWLSIKQYLTEDGSLLNPTVADSFMGSGQVAVLEDGSCRSENDCVAVKMAAAPHTVLLVVIFDTTRMGALDQVDARYQTLVEMLTGS